MNGKILLESEENKGSKFILKLNQVVLADDVDGRDSKLKAENDNITFKPARILIVDDIEDNRTVLQLKLRKYRFEIFEAANAKEALAILKITPDIMFIDLHMPEITGYELYQKISEDNV